MKNFLVGLILVASLPVWGQQRIKSKHSGNPSPKETPVADVKNDKLNYAIGFVIGKKLLADSIVLKPEMIFEAMRSLTGKSVPMMTEEEVMLTLQAFESEIRAKRELEEAVEVDTSSPSPEEYAVDSSSAGSTDETSLNDMEKIRVAAENEAKGKGWLEANKKNEGIKELPSGLQYQIIRKGKGDCPKTTSKVLVQYVGTKVDGTIFDSSIERDLPAVLPVNGVIKGWTEALQLMNPGAKWKLFVPANLAYGVDGAGPIEPGEMLIFEVELLYIMN